jgi:FMN-dependent NADH-azoreductase
MKTRVLVIDSSTAGEASVSRKVTEAVLNSLRAKYPDPDVKIYDLAMSPFPHVDPLFTAALFQSMSTPPDQQSDAIKATLARSNEAVQDLMWADHIVIGVPFYNFTIPSTLKAWIDHVCRAGVTFRYTENGPEGFVRGKKVYLVISSGGVYSSDPMKKALDFTEPYLKAVLGFLGMTDVVTYRAEGTAIPGLREKAIEQAISSIHL